MIDLFASSGLYLARTSKGDPGLRQAMTVHYSQPRGFVGRQIFYRVEYNREIYGYIAFGSATRFLPGRDKNVKLDRGVNNIFYHIEKVGGKYPMRNFTTRVLLEAEKIVIMDYPKLYGSPVEWFETLVELPRSGELYRRAGYKNVGVTKGYTCKRVGGRGTDAWSGKRVWDCNNLRPKLVFLKEVAA